MPYLQDFYGFYNLWELNHKVVFDGVERLIYVNEGETLLDVKSDLYSAWKQWIQQEDYMKYYAPFDTVGGEPIVGGQSLDTTFFLINNWKIKPYPGSYTLDIIGNLFEVDGGSIKVDADVVTNVPNNIAINLNTSVIVRQISTSGSAGGIVTASLVDPQQDALFDIQGRVISIQSTLSLPLTASLVPDQAAILEDLQSKLTEVWKIHGLDASNPLLVTQTQRVVSDVSQSISTIGSGSTQQTTLTRLP